MGDKQHAVRYFDGLNALRFFAAFLVVLQHAETIRHKYEMPDLQRFSLFQNGGIAVTFFFVLSGFLITYLLLAEKFKTQNVSIKHFYIRRILRIWPLYFLLVLLGTLAVPFAIQIIGYNYEIPYRFVDVIGYFVCFMPFMVNIRFGHHLLEPLWSIGVEEIFYLAWAPLFKWIKKRLLFLVFAVIICKLLLSAIILGFGITNIFAKTVGMLQFEAMAVGALGAYLVFNGKINFQKNMLFSKTFQICCYLFLICRIFACNYLKEWTVFNVIFTSPICSGYLLIFVFMWLIINVSLNERSFLKLRGKTLNFLGEISYGIYMYHMLVIFCITLIFKNMLTSLNLPASSLIFYSLLTGSVILISYLSKKYFEDYFLRLKSKFAS